MIRLLCLVVLLFSIPFVPYRLGLCGSEKRRSAMLQDFSLYSALQTVQASKVLLSLANKYALVVLDMEWTSSYNEQTYFNELSMLLVAVRVSGSLYAGLNLQSALLLMPSNGHHLV